MPSEHIYNPADSSLEARIEALKQVLNAWREVKINLENVQNSRYSDQLGSEEQVMEAKTVIDNSIKKASIDLDNEAIQKAREHGQLSSDDVKDFVIARREQEMSDFQESQDSTSHSHQQ